MVLQQRLHQAGVQPDAKRRLSDIRVTVVPEKSDTGIMVGGHKMVAGSGSAAVEALQRDKEKRIAEEGQLHSRNVISSCLSRSSVRPDMYSNLH